MFNLSNFWGAVQIKTDTLINQDDMNNLRNISK